jgi:hypothetical protein
MPPIPFPLTIWTNPRSARSGLGHRRSPRAVPTGEPHTVPAIAVRSASFGAISRVGSTAADRNEPAHETARSDLRDTPQPVDPPPGAEPRRSRFNFRPRRREKQKHALENWQQSSDQGTSAPTWCTTFCGRNMLNRGTWWASIPAARGLTGLPNSASRIQLSESTGFSPRRSRPTSFSKPPWPPYSRRCASAAGTAVIALVESTEVSLAAA